MKTRPVAKQPSPNGKSRPAAAAGSKRGATVAKSPASAPVDENHMLLEALQAFRQGDFSVRLPAVWTGIYGKIADAFNDVLSTNERRAKETQRVSNVVGREGRLKQRMSVPGLIGGWADEVHAWNALIDDLVRPTTEPP